MISTGQMYIVKIYRRDDKNPYSLIGVIEDATTSTKKIFRTPTEFVSILLNNKTWASAFKKIEEEKNNGLNKGIPVQISGINEQRKKFKENTAIVALTPTGGQFFIKNRVKRDANLTLKFTPATTGATVKVTVLSSKAAEEGILTKVAFENTL